MPSTSRGWARLIIDPWADMVSNSEWAKQTVLGVCGRNVTIEVLLHFRNGTETTIIDKIDVATGLSNVSDSVLIFPCLVVARNLSVGDPYAFSSRIASG